MMCTFTDRLRRQQTYPVSCIHNIEEQESRAVIKSIVGEVKDAVDLLHSLVVNHPKHHVTISVSYHRSHVHIRPGSWSSVGIWTIDTADWEGPVVWNWCKGYCPAKLKQSVLIATQLQASA